MKRQTIMAKLAKLAGMARTDTIAKKNKNAQMQKASWDIPAIMVRSAKMARMTKWPY